MSDPITALLDKVEWTPQEPPAENPDSLPFVTHSGVLEIAGHKLPVYQLSSGQRIFSADEFAAFMESLL